MEPGLIGGSPRAAASLVATGIGGADRAGSFAMLGVLVLLEIGLIAPFDGLTFAGCELCGNGFKVNPLN